MYLRRKPLTLTTLVVVPNFGAGPSASSRLLMDAHKLASASFAFTRGTKGLKKLLTSSGFFLSSTSPHDEAEGTHTPQCAASLTPRGTRCFSHDARSGGDIQRPYRSGLRDVAQGGVAGAADSEHQNWISAMVLVPEARLPPRPCLLQADSAPPLTHKVSLDSEPALGDAVGRHSNVKCPLWRSETGGDVADGPVAWCIAESRNDRPLQYRAKPKSGRC